MTIPARRIGTTGTVSRVIAGLGLLCLAFTHGRLSWGLTWYDAVLGLIAFPAVMVVTGLAARRFAHRAVRLTGPLGLAVNTAVIVALLASRYTAGGAELFYGATLLVAAWRAQPGCEATVLSNLILSRDDQIGCPAFTPIDALEARRPAGTNGPPSTLRPAKPDRQGPLQRSQYMAASQQLPTGRPDSRPGRQPARNPLLHLTACLAITAIAALAILAIHVLT